MGTLRTVIMSTVDEHRMVEPRSTSLSDGTLERCAASAFRLDYM
jgi:hypothetical protein